MMKRSQVRAASLACVIAALSGCAEKPIVHATPAAEDVRALVERKPKPPISILTDPAANDRYNAEVEAWGDRLRSAGVRLCAFFANQGMIIDCIEAESPSGATLPLTRQR
jgi:hypothetical protein